jgi:hypothetical protein
MLENRCHRRTAPPAKTIKLYSVPPVVQIERIRQHCSLFAATLQLPSKKRKLLIRRKIARNVSTSSKNLLISLKGSVGLAKTLVCWQPF